MPAGRPSEYSTETADEFCARIAEGESLRTICLDGHMPALTTIFRWMRTHEDFRQQYARAKEQQADAMAEEIIDIADDATNDWMEKHDQHGNSIGYQLNGDHVQRSKLRIESRKWLMGKLKPKKYGDKVQTEHSGPDGAAIQVITGVPSAAD